jgi:hypothetical protein
LRELQAARAGIARLRNKLRSHIATGDEQDALTGLIGLEILQLELAIDDLDLAIKILGASGVHRT